MPLIDYAQKRQERVLVRSQSAMGVFNWPTARDALKLRGPATIPAVLSDFVPSEEIRETPDVDQFIKRKKPPGEFELTMYAKVPSTKGRFPQWGLLMRDTFGVETLIITILNFTNLETNNNTVTVTIDGTPTVLTEDVEWQAGASNSAAATSLASAINALSGVSATAVGAEVRVTRDLGCGEVAITSNAPLTDLLLGEVRYTLKTDILEEVFTLQHGTHNGVDTYRDCKVSAVQFLASGTDEANLVFSGFLGNGVTAGQTTLVGSISNGGRGTTPFNFTVAEAMYQVGPSTEDFVYVQIDAEIIKIPAAAWNPDTKTVTGAIGAQLGTSSAAHSNGAIVEPYIAGADPDPNDSIIPLTLGEFKLDSSVYRIINLDLVKDEQLNGRLDEWAESALTGYRRDIAGRQVEGTFVAYQRRTVLELVTFGEREKEADGQITIGSTPLLKPRIQINVPKFRIGKVEKDEQDGEFTRSFPFQGLASSTPGNDGIDLQVFN